MKKLLIIVIEGCSLEYISREITPNIYRIAKDGFCKCVKAAVPTTTNVNHATILSGKFPCENGVAGNDIIEETPENQEILKQYSRKNIETIMDYMHKQGSSTALLSVNKEVLDTFGRGVGFGISAENAKDILVGYLGMTPPPPVDSLQASTWILEACYNLLKKNSINVVYCTTNDYMMHNYPPESKEAIRQMREIDEWLGKIYDLDHSSEMYITGGYGMNKKTHVANIKSILKNNGFDVMCYPHNIEQTKNTGDMKLSGMMFVNMAEKQKKHAAKLVEYLEDLPCVDIVSERAEAIKRFNLPEELVGDYLVFAADGYAFSEFEGENMELESGRSHGSLYERAIPLIAVNSGQVPEKYRYSRDIVKILMEKDKQQ